MQRVNEETPMYANYGYTPTVYGEAREAKDSPAATKAAEQLKQLHEELKTDLQFIQQRMARYADQRRMKEPSFKKGDKVYLARKNIKSKRPSEKLDYKQLGPFKIKRKISDTNYELSLPRSMQIHPIFHISLLEPASPRAKLDETTELEAEDEEEQEVEKILDHRGEGPQTEYLVKWKDQGDDENTWEPLDHLTNAQGMLVQYHQLAKTPRRGARRGARR